MLEPTVRFIRNRFAGGKGSWESSVAYFVVKEVIKPLELFMIAAASGTILEHIVPAVTSMPFRYVSHVVREPWEGRNLGRSQALGLRS